MRKAGVLEVTTTIPESLYYVHWVGKEPALAAVDVVELQGVRYLLRTGQTVNHDLSLTPFGLTPAEAWERAVERQCQLVVGATNAVQQAREDAAEAKRLLDVVVHAQRELAP